MPHDSDDEEVSALTGFLYGLGCLGVIVLLWLMMWGIWKAGQAVFGDAW